MSWLDLIWNNLLGLISSNLTHAHLEVAVLVISGKVVVETKDLEGILVRDVHHPIRRHSDGRHRPKHSRRGEGRL